MANDPGILSDFNFQSDAFQDTLQAELVDALSFKSSGILTDGSGFLDKTKTGEFINVPQYETLADAMTQVTTGSEKTTNDFADYKSTAVWVQREGAWGIESLVKTITGKDPLTEIARQVANKVAVTIQTTVINVLKGIFATALSSSHSTGTTYTGSTIDYDGIFGAKQKLGDAQMQLTRVIANSKVVSDIGGLNRAVFTNTTLGVEAAVNAVVPVVAGMNTWMEDAITAVSSVYSTYISAPGAIIFLIGNWSRRDVNGNPVVSNGIDVEFQRIAEVGGGTDNIFVRVRYMVHPMGMEYNSATVNPTDAQLATGSNWTKSVDDDRKIKIVELKTL